MSNQRSEDNQNTNQALLKIQNVNERKSASFYFGKRVAYIQKSSDKDHKYKVLSLIQCIWGKVCRAHGDNGVVIAKFRHNLPPRAMGATLRVMLYPNRA